MADISNIGIGDMQPEAGLDGFVLIIAQVAFGNKYVFYLG